MPFAKLVSSIKINEQIHDILRHQKNGLPARVIFSKIFKDARLGAKLSDDYMLAVLAEDSRFFRDEDNRWRVQPAKPPSGKIWSHEYVAFDVEATGSNPMYHRLLEIGAVRVVDGELKETFSTLVNPGRRIPPYIKKMTGISPEMVKDSPSVLEATDAFLEFLGDGILIAHNAVFDRRFLRCHLAMERHVTFPNDSLCTLRMSRRLLRKKVKRFGLGNLCDLFEITIENRHRALGDALGCAELFLKMVDLLENRGASALAHLKEYENTGKFQGMAIPQDEFMPCEEMAE